jgi:hypothetical protein
VTGVRAVQSLVCLVVCASLAACAEAKATSSNVYKPSSLSTVTGDPDTHLVTLTSMAAERIGLKTAVVAQDGPSKAVPSAATLFGPEGRSFVYTATTPLTFLRVEIHVQADDGKVTRFTDGPPPGTLVVTTGVTEVYGAEFEVGH